MIQVITHLEALDVAGIGAHPTHINMGSAAAVSYF